MLQAKYKLGGECQVQFYLNDTEVTGECSKYCTNILTTCTVLSLSLYLSLSHVRKEDKSLSHVVDHVHIHVMTLLQLPHVPYCKPGYECPTGQVSYELIIEHSHIIMIA